MPAIGSSRDNSSGTGSGVNSGSGISRSNANDGFNAAHDNTNTGTQEVGKRLKTLKDAAEDGANPAAEDATSRKRGAAVGGGEAVTVNLMKVTLIIPFTEYGLAHITAKRYKKPLTDLAVIKLNLPVAQSGSIPL
ncbi:hypothetical protein RAS_13930 [Rickettsia asiatica]|uniref:Uncharacterized protein n=1 Tax=Rickettsia asiatica TaxID=238800 RepID=A0A510GBJ4_9RICK|nr:hypothetical protein [Rickettsia asiatica]BBJ32284.1 hypothetical protein RAS_13930 [Rickettsia asiatica]